MVSRMLIKKDWRKLSRFSGGQVTGLNEQARISTGPAINYYYNLLGNRQFARQYCFTYRPIFVGLRTLVNVGRVVPHVFSINEGHRSFPTVRTPPFLLFLAASHAVRTRELEISGPVIPEEYASGLCILEYDSCDDEGVVPLDTDGLTVDQGLAIQLISPIASQEISPLSK